MRSGNKIWSTMVDYFLILGAIIGVGFASGKEICVFFFDDLKLHGCKQHLQQDRFH